MAVENPILNLENLSFLKRKIELNDAGTQEFEQLQFFISTIGGEADFVFRRLQQNNFNSFEEYKLTIQKEPENKNARAFKAYMLGALSVIFDQINKSSK